MILLEAEFWAIREGAHTITPDEKHGFGIGSRYALSAPDPPNSRLLASSGGEIATGAGANWRGGEGKEEV